MSHTCPLKTLIQGEGYLSQLSEGPSSLSLGPGVSLCSQPAVRRPCLGLHWERSCLVSWVGFKETSPEAGVALI